MISGRPARAGRPFSLLQPTSRESGPREALHDRAATAHEVPGHPRPEVLDHEDDRALVETVVAPGDPAALVAVPRAKRRVQAAEKSIAASHVRIALEVTRERRQHDLRSEGERRDDRPR